ncbi:MAG: ABC transporter permease [bacterium]|nr:ABC transporter permease [bacterium]
MKMKFLQTESITEYSLMTSLFLLLPVIFLYLIFFIYPLARLFPISLFQPDFTLDNYIHFIDKPLYIKVLLRTLRVSVIVAAVCLLIGYPVAYLLAFTKGKRRMIYLGCIILPFWTSILVRNYAWIILLQRKGVINTVLQWVELIDKPLRLLYTEPAVQIGMIHFLLPFMILPIYSVLKRIDPNLVLAASNLGARPWSAFFHVTFPLSFPGVGAGLSIVFIIGLGFFITPALLGGPNDLMISTLIEKQINVDDWPFASAIAFILLFITVILIMVFNKVVGLNRLYNQEL